MKIISSVIFTIFLLTITFSALAKDKENSSNPDDRKHVKKECSPAPRCERGRDSSSDTLEQWIDRLTMQQLMELLTTQQEQSAENPKTPNE
jgi:hypothetical protein